LTREAPQLLAWSIVLNWKSQGWFGFQWGGLQPVWFLDWVAIRKSDRLKPVLHHAQLKLA
jgi:hypothetical protein